MTQSTVNQIENREIAAWKEYQAALKISEEFRAKWDVLATELAKARYELKMQEFNKNIAERYGSGMEVVV